MAKKGDVTRSYFDLAVGWFARCVSQLLADSAQVIIVPSDKKPFQIPLAEPFLIRHNVFNLFWDIDPRKNIRHLNRQRNRLQSGQTFTSLLAFYFVPVNQHLPLPAYRICRKGMKRRDVAWLTNGHTFWTSD
jgi:hypothetical protein